MAREVVSRCGFACLERFKLLARAKGNNVHRQRGSTRCYGGDHDIDKSNWPRQRGFDRFWGTIHGAGSFYDPVTLTDENDPIKPESNDFYYTTAIAENAVRLIDESPRDKPFFLYMPFTSPHWPLHAPDEDIARYKGKYDIGWDELRKQRHQRMIEMGVISKEWDLTPRDQVVVPWEEAENKEWQSRRMEV